jgi:hypothetical protein
MALLLDTMAPARLVADGSLIIDAGYNVLGIELYDRGHAPELPIVTGRDFFDLTAANCDGLAAIVTNPPYGRGLVDRFLRHAIDLLPEGGELHALMRHNWMTGIRRRDLLPSLRRIIMCRRLNMLPYDREHEDKGHNGQSDFSWYTFQKGCTVGACELLHARQ